jgi:hypothetical protein
MRTKLRPWHLGVGLIAICILILWTLSYWRGRGVATPAAMLACLPRSGAVSVYLDANALRSSGLLDLIAGSKATEEIEYQRFVAGTAFDYRNHLHSLAATFSGGTTHLVVRGSFDWKKLSAYAAAQGGTCQNSLCRVPGGSGRFVSFYPLRSDAMAIAFSADEWAALEITPRNAAPPDPQPDQPVWISVTGPALRDVKTLPSGARSFVSPLESAESIVLSMGANEEKLELNLSVVCISETTASELVMQLEGATNMLRKMLERENQKPNPRDLSGMLVAGNFRREDRRVLGTWPMHREFISTLASGSMD